MFYSPFSPRTSLTIWSRCWSKWLFISSKLASDDSSIPAWPFALVEALRGVAFLQVHGIEMDGLHGADVEGCGRGRVAGVEAYMVLGIPAWAAARRRCSCQRRSAVRRAISRARAEASAAACADSTPCAAPLPLTGRVAASRHSAASRGARQRMVPDEGLVPIRSFPVMPKLRRLLPSEPLPQIEGPQSQFFTNP